jgi:hypothetical protein
MPAMNPADPPSASREVKDLSLVEGGIPGAEVVD